VFDRFVVVDWSANSAPKSGRDSIWIAEHDRNGDVAVTNLATRAAAQAFLVERLGSDPTSSTLLGVDFSLGYPAGTAAALGLTGERWSAMWDLLAEHIDDDDRNANNRFDIAAELNRRITGGAAPFWGCPPAKVTPTLSATKPRSWGEPGEWRAVEDRLRANGRRPFSSWQLLGAGAVGSQSLLGIPMIARLRERLGDRIRIWPFDTGFEHPVLDDGAIVVAEVWPSLLPIDTTDMVRDAAQVIATARWMAASQRSGGLDALFSPSMPSVVSAAAIAEEGWVLGVTV
jgi:precorrin-8X/cobalt-precorrin-8 methylmutase